MTHHHHFPSGTSYKRRLCRITPLPGKQALFFGGRTIFCNYGLHYDDGAVCVKIIYSLQDSNQKGRLDLSSHRALVYCHVSPQHLLASLLAHLLNVFRETPLMLDIFSLVIIKGFHMHGIVEVLLGVMTATQSVRCHSLAQQAPNANAFLV